MTQISFLENRLKLFFRLEFQDFPVLEVTNLLRCDLFIIVDSILFHNWHNSGVIYYLILS